MKDLGPRPHSANRLIAAPSQRFDSAVRDRSTPSEVRWAPRLSPPENRRPAGCRPPSNGEDAWTSASPRLCRFDVSLHMS